jgi:hypothetical protein
MLMARKLDWEKDRRRTLGKLATLEDAVEVRKLAAAARRTPEMRRIPSKADLRSFGEKMVQQKQAGIRGSWSVTCGTCGHKRQVQIALSAALETVLRCGCGHEQWLTSEDLKPPWDE